MHIVNLTPHDIKIISNGVFNADLRKFTTDDPEIVISIPSSGVVSATLTTVEIEPINGVPVFDKKITGVDPLPEGDDDTIYVVSALYASAYRKIHGNADKLYTIADPVYSTDGRTILGSRGICPFI
jgi:hypothetical protein